MPERAPRLRAPLSKGSKLLLAMAALGFLGAGLYLILQLAKPSPPDLDAPGQQADEPEAAAERAPSVDTVVEEPLIEAIVDELPLEIVRQPPPSPGGAPRIALVIDDLGRSLGDLDTLATLGVPVTYAVLPYESHTPEVVRELNRRGAEVMLHLPMEAKNGADPGPGALLVSMSAEEIEGATRQALEAVPGAIGVNNHMGSFLSENQQAITPVISVLAERQLFFLDSRTSPETVGYSVARRLGIPAAERQIFLDTEIETEFIREQFARLLQVARERGGAIAIGHPHRLTLEILASEVPAARERGYEFVTASSMLEGG